MSAARALVLRSPSASPKLRRCFNRLRKPPYVTCRFAGLLVWNESGVLGARTRRLPPRHGFVPRRERRARPQTLPLRPECLHGACKHPVPEFGARQGSGGPSRSPAFVVAGTKRGGPAGISGSRNQFGAFSARLPHRPLPGGSPQAVPRARGHRRRLRTPQPGKPGRVLSMRGSAVLMASSSGDHSMMIVSTSTIGSPPGCLGSHLRHAGELPARRRSRARGSLHPRLERAMHAPLPTYTYRSAVVISQLWPPQRVAPRPASVCAVPAWRASRRIPPPSRQALPLTKVR